MPRVDLDRLRELHAQGLSDPLVAAELGCCVKSVSNWRRRLKLREGGNVRHQTRRFSDDDLRALHAEGLTDTDISERLGVSRGAVQWRRVMLDLPSTCAGRPHLPFDVETLLAHHAAGLTDPDIARLMGTTGCRIKYQRNKLGLAGNYKPGSPSLSNGKLRALHSEGLTDREIAARVGLSVATVGERRRNLSLPAQRRPPMSADPDRVAQLRGEGLSYAEIGRRLGCGKSTAGRACLRLGVAENAVPPPRKTPVPAPVPVKAKSKAAPLKAKPRVAAVKDFGAPSGAAPRPSGLQAVIEMARRESAAMKRAGRI
ncbi:MAG TPA: hypothetical protein DEB47_07175 [Citreicella sp.]|nr:hypothetical protein [Citreicella sp.]